MGTLPLFLLQAETAAACREGCCGKCTGEFGVSHGTSSAFPWEGFEVCWFIAHYFELEEEAWQHVPRVWNLFGRPDEREKRSRKAQRARRAARSRPRGPWIPQPGKPFKLRCLGSTLWLRGEIALLKDWYDCGHLFDEWVERQKEETGNYPRTRSAALSWW